MRHYFLEQDTRTMTDNQIGIDYVIINCSFKTSWSGGGELEHIEARKGP